MKKVLIDKVIFVNDGKYHRIGMPSMIFYPSEEFNFELKQWFFNGKCHRISGRSIYFGGGFGEVRDCSRLYNKLLEINTKTLVL